METTNIIAALVKAATLVTEAEADVGVPTVSVDLAPGDRIVSGVVGAATAAASMAAHLADNGDVALLHNIVRNLKVQEGIM